MIKIEIDSDGSSRSLLPKQRLAELIGHADISRCIERLWQL